MTSNSTTTKPEILAPAGSRASFLAALAAGADAVYCGLKQFSARMEAKNFQLEELAALTALAHDRRAKVYVTLNSLLKTDDLDAVGELLTVLQQRVKPDALIVQDPGLIPLAGQAGYAGEIHLSTLSNVSFAAALQTLRRFPQVRRVVLPRELSIDEIKTMAEQCPEGLSLEVFIHGALCYAVSGRCYWSSYLGGKSGLRGRCVQPCRRMYRQGEHNSRFFSCLDLSLDVLVKVLGEIPQVRGWKIEGRKKGPHYVYYTVSAYQILRDLDLQDDGKAAAKKGALELLDQALGRSGTHYGFLPQRPQNPVDVKMQTGSGLYVGRVRGPKQRPYLVPGIELLSGDVLRFGYEDQDRHAVQRLGRSVPKKGRLMLQTAARRLPVPGTPVFLTDRREKALEEMLGSLEAQLHQQPAVRQVGPRFRTKLPRPERSRKRLGAMIVQRTYHKTREGHLGLWLSDANLHSVPPRDVARIWWWLPVVVWPADESALQQRLRQVRAGGGRHFVLGAPWQTALFEAPEKLDLWAGPFCNLANPLALQAAAAVGCNGAIVSPELGGSDYLALPEHSPLPLGIVVQGSWPLCISRTVTESLRTEEVFISPKGEQSWVRHYDSGYWVFPNWEVDLTGKIDALRAAGYRLFAYLKEPLPKGVKMKKRPGLWNWDIGLQ